VNPSDPDADDLEPIAEQVADLLAKHDAALAGLRHLAQEFSALTFKVDPQRWPAPGPAKRSAWVGPPPTPREGLQPVDVVNRWRAEREAWLTPTNAAAMRAAAIALRVQPHAGILASDQAFLKALLPNLKGSRHVGAVVHAVLATWPPPALALEHLAELRAQDLPRWAKQRGRDVPTATSLARALALQVVSGALQKPGDLDLPETVWDGAWAAQIITAAPVRALEPARNQLRFADAGKDRHDAPITAATAAALTSLVDVGKATPHARREIAALLSQRVGSPFRSDAEARWSRVSHLLPTVRAWLAGEVLEIVFEHLTPSRGAGAHMTADRKIFWKGYTDSVRCIWIAVSDAIRPTLARDPDVRRVRDAMGSAFEVRRLKGGPEQALVWMHLDGRDGVVTVVEGNSNTSLRLRWGEIKPPTGTIDYTADVVHGKFASHNDVYEKRHKGNWEADVRDQLNTMGIAGRR
jgi:hypothetical protein